MPRRCRLLRRSALVLLLASLGAAALAAEPVEATRSPDPAATARPDRWAPLRAFLGTWEGTSRGEPGTGTVRREYRLVLGDRFIEARNRTAYAPRQKTPRGEVHEDVGYLSVDRGRQVFVLRQFHVEGFVNTYVAPVSTASPEPIVFVTEAIENLPPGWRARETYRFEGPDVLVEVFELAEPGKEFKPYSEARLTRAR
ncbi:MAG: FABP family protein [Anaeromyxobacteraceae bacterium]|nr:FABP family protein [Anaeromyxobacteraceae bacterium]